jgi:MOSC domain-containing protein YiiM
MDGATPETCAECGFDSRWWRVSDAATLLGALGYWWRLATGGVAAEDLNRRPAPGVWSALEYGLHTALVTASIRRGIELILAEDGCALPVPPGAAGASDHDAVGLEPGQIVDSLEHEGTALADLARTPSAAWGNVGQLAAWGNVGQLSDTRIRPEAALLHAVHDASHHFMDVARGLAVLEIGTPGGLATVARVNVSDGGVPKVAIDGDRVGWRGLASDRHAEVKHHGRPFQALCLWSAEVIAELATAGHPIAAGCAGENLTVSGLDWSSLRSGARLRVGTALAEISFPAVPCRKQTRWFADGDFSRIAHERNPQWARWYAWVREPGYVTTGDPVALQP